MWDVFPDDMGLDNSVEFELANLDLNELVLKTITFYYGDPRVILHTRKYIDWIGCKGGGAEGWRSENWQ